MAVPFVISAALGPFLIGVILNAMLYGICAVQCFIYYRNYKGDSTWIRYFVLYLFVMETCNTVFDIGMVFEPLILNFGNPVAFTRTPTMIIPDGIVTVMLSTPVQFFIAWRIQFVSKSWLMPLIIGFFGTCSFIGGLAVTILADFIRDRAKQQRLEPALITWLVSSATADVLITISLSWALIKRKTGIKATDNHISRIVLLTVQTGTLTTIFALADVIVFLTAPATNVNFAFDLALSKLYTNSLLSTFNSRVRNDKLAGQAVNQDATALFGQMGTRMDSEFSQLAFGQNRTNTTDMIELDERGLGDDHLKRETLESGLRVHNMVQQYSG